MAQKESAKVQELLSATGSDLFGSIGAYLAELEFTVDILEDENDFIELFAEDDDCTRIGLPITNQQKELKEFILKKAENMIKDYFVNHNKSKMLNLKAIQLKTCLLEQNALAYQEFGKILFKYQVNANDINQADKLKVFLTKNDLNKIGLKNAAKQKLAFRKILRLVNDVKKQPEPQQVMSPTP
eukprot:218402_1